MTLKKLCILFSKEQELITVIPKEHNGSDLHSIWDSDEQNGMRIQMNGLHYGMELETTIDSKME